MKIIHLIIFLIFFLSNNLNAKPRCDLFFDEVYSSSAFPTDEDLLSVPDEQDIGIELLGLWNNENQKISLIKNKEGYYIVGKVTLNSLIAQNETEYDKIKVGDIILSINGKDLRESYNEDEFGTLIGRSFETDKKIKFKLERILTNGNKKVFELETVSKLSEYNQYYADIDIDYINIDEKNGSFEARIEGVYDEFELDEDFQVTKSAHKYLVQALGDDVKYLEYPSIEKINNLQRWLYECSFSEDKWTSTNSRYPYYYMKWLNLIKENADTISRSEYVIGPNFYYEDDDDKEPDKTSFVTFYRDSIVEIKNDFNLKSFPFDRQKLTLKLFTESDLNFVKLTMSGLTVVNLEEFKEENSINGWNIKEIKLSNSFVKKPAFDHFFDSVQIDIIVDRKSGYYIFKIIVPIILILMICWSSVWINPREIESRLTITIVCLLSLIAYNFVIDADMPKLEYLTIMDYIILISYVYSAIPNFLSIYSFYLHKLDKQRTEKYELIEKKYGLSSYLLIILIIILFNVNNAPENTNAMFTWAAVR